METFTPAHICARPEDFLGNGNRGRYVLLPGSDGRAQAISRHFDNLVIHQHPRGHHLYLGSISHQKGIIDVATLSSGMGCPSMEIILHELFHLGAKRFLRVGTSGSLQPDRLKIGDIINVQAAVRDEHTTEDYVPLGVPAIASWEVVSAIAEAARVKSFSEVHTGIVHCKSSLYAREMGFGPLAESNKATLAVFSRYGVLASEMETAALFIQSQYYDHLCKQKQMGRVLCGALLGIIFCPERGIASSVELVKLNERLIQLALETIILLHYEDEMGSLAIK